MSSWQVEGCSPPLKMSMTATLVVRMPGFREPRRAAAGQAAGLAVDDADGVIGEEGVGPACVLDVPADVPVGLRRGERGRGDVVAELDALVEGGHVTHPQAPAQGGLADQHDG